MHSEPVWVSRLPLAQAQEAAEEARKEHAGALAELERLQEQGASSGGQEQIDQLQADLAKAQEELAQAREEAEAAAREHAQAPFQSSAARAHSGCSCSACGTQKPARGRVVA